MRHGIIKNFKKSTMKHIICIPLVMCSFICGDAFAQNPVPEADTVSNPAQEGDPALRTLPPGLDYVDGDRSRVMPEELPEPVKQTLESGAEYINWQKARIFKKNDKEEYIIEFKEADKTTTYRFNKDGRPVFED
jgi:hypothetical protein